MDFVILLSRTGCGDYRFVELNAVDAIAATDNDVGADTAEIWVVDACGERSSYLIVPKICNEQSATMAIAVAPETERRPRSIFYGAAALNADTAIDCPNL